MDRFCVIKEYVLRPFDEIADSYDRLRGKAWSNALSYLPVKPFSMILDLGCGSGSNSVYLASKGLRVIPCDISFRMICLLRSKALRRKVYDLIDPLVAEATMLPFRGKVFEYAIAIASLHNLPFKASRIKALTEIKRTLKPKGLLLLTVWAFHQYKFPRLRKFKELLLLLRDPLSSFVPWKHRGAEVLRYYHFYRRSELIEDLRRGGFKVLDAYKWDFKPKTLPRNYLAIAIKT